MPITSQKEKFAQSIVSGMNQSDAYRSAYKVRPNTKPESVNQAASKLMADPNLVSRVDELRKPVIAAAQITLESHLNDLKGLRNMATKASQFAAAISAEVSRGKASGLYTEKVVATVTTITENPALTHEQLLDECARRGLPASVFQKLNDESE